MKNIENFKDFNIFSYNYFEICLLDVNNRFTSIRDLKTKTSTKNQNKCMFSKEMYN